MTLEEPVRVLLFVVRFSFRLAVFYRWIPAQNCTKSGRGKILKSSLFSLDGPASLRCFLAAAFPAGAVGCFWPVAAAFARMPDVGTRMMTCELVLAVSEGLGGTT